MSKVFLSHSSRDNVAAEALVSWLQSAEPALVDEIFFDRDVKNGIVAGERWKTALKDASDRCEAVICLLSRSWDASRECQVEYRAAEYLGKPVFPVRLEPASGRDITAEWQRCDLFGDGPKTPVAVNDGAQSVEFLTAGLERLRNGLRTIGVAPDAFRWPPQDDPDRSPYRGWQPLESVDAAVYFGRDVEINRAMSAIRALRAAGTKRAFTILGPSGAGKSSFLRAGLLPRLRRDDRHFLTMPIVRPDRHPLSGELGLAKSIHELRSSLGLDEPELGGIKAGVADTVNVRTWLTEAQTAAVKRFVNGQSPAAPTLILPVDQAEELFCADAGAESGDFLTVVADLAATASDLPIMVLATIRTDRYELFQTAPQLADVDPYAFEDLKPMRPNRFREVICGPADRLESAGSRLRWAPEVVERILQACDSSADALPLLSLTLARLYEDFGGDGEITLDEYESMGGMGRVVETEIESVLSTEPATRAGELEQLRRVFIPWLATINPVNNMPLRRVARLFDLPADGHRLVEALVARRLLTEDERDGEKVIEVSLESLLRQWDTLSTWLREEAADLKDADFLDQKTRAWSENDRQDDWLLSGAQLTDAEALAAKPGFRDRLNTAREYLLASRQREDERTAADLREAEEHRDNAERLVEVERRANRDAQHGSRVLRRVAALTATVAVVAAGLAAWALVERANAEEQFLHATAQRLLAESRAMLAGQSPNGDNDVLAMQLLLAARGLAPTMPSDADYQLLTVLNQERDVVRIADAPTKVISVAVDPNGGRVAAGGADNTIRLWDTDTGRWSPTALTGHRGMVTSVAFSPDGGALASGSADDTVRVWDVANGTQRAEMSGHQGAVVRVAWSPDGARIASGSTDGTVRIWDARRGTSIATLAGGGATINGVAFDRDGTRIVTGSADGTVRIWDTQRGTEIARLLGHSADVVRVAWSPDGSRIASASTDGTVRIWDPDRRTIVHVLDNGRIPVLSVAFSPDGSRITSGGDDRTVRLWDAVTGRPIATLDGHDSKVLDVQFTADGLKVVSTGDDGDDTMRLWDASSWQPIRGDETAAQYATLRSGARSIVAVGDDGTVRSWDTVTGRPVGAPLRFADGQSRLVGVRAGRVLTADATGTVQLWDVVSADGRWTRLSPNAIGEPLRVDPQRVALADYDPAGTVAVAPESAQTVRLFDARTAAPLSAPVRLDHPVTAVAVMPGGNGFATAENDSVVRLWDRDGAPLGPPIINEEPVTGLAFGTGGDILAAWGGRRLRLWDTGNAQPIGETLRARSQITAVAFDGGGTLLAAGGADGAIALRGVHDGDTPLPSLAGAGADVTSLEFSPVGTRLLSAYDDGTVQVWPVGAVTADPPKSLCTKLSSNMSEQQWRQWLPGIDYRDQCDGLPRADDTGEAS
ncbi:MAG: TIR domain-containing protein [Actinobacteria bacterium]|nr:TIR domain-containing protein [Actinomycetota bacterium]